MSEDVVYYNQQLWSHVDYQISTSTCSIEKFTSRDKYNISPVKLKISVNNFKQRINSNITLSHSEIFSFISKYKEYESKLSSIISNISSDQNLQETFLIKNSKKFLIVTFLYRTEYGGSCVRIVISDKNSNYLDSEKVYMSIHDFLSFTMIIGQYRSNYLQTSDMMMSMISTKDLNDNIALLNEKIDILNDKVTSYFTQFLSTSRPISNVSASSSDLIHSDIIPDLVITNENCSSSSVQMADDFDPFTSEIHDTMTSYLKEEVPKVDLNLSSDGTVVVKKEINIDQAISTKNTLTEKILLNDILNLEMYLSTIVNDELPFEKFLQLIKNKLNFDPIGGHSLEERNTINYVLSNYLKHHIKQSLENKIALPSSNIPIMLNTKTVPDENKISLAYDLLLYSVYYTQLKNILKDKDYSIIANKELVCMILKSISIPLMFDPLSSIDETVILSELSTRLRKYNDIGVFTKLQDSLFETKKIRFTLSDGVLKTEASRMIKAINSNRDKFNVKNIYSDIKFLMVSYDDLQKNKLTEEQIKRIITAEFNFKKNKKLNFEECKISKFDDIPSSIAEKFGVVIKKYDNTNLKRYVKESCKNNETTLKLCLDVVGNINQSYRDLKCVNVDYVKVPEDVLKAIYNWDLIKDQKISDNYIYYTDLIKNTSLSRDMIISMLLNITDVGIDTEFTNSFLAAREF